MEGGEGEASSKDSALIFPKNSFSNGSMLSETSNIPTSQTLTKIKSIPPINLILPILCGTAFLY
jgi:hypothetical protein